MPRAPATDNNNIVILHLSLERYLIDHPSSIATHTLPHDNPTAAPLRAAAGGGGGGGGRDDHHGLK
jgi:hypothetical protein